MRLSSICFVIQATVLKVVQVAQERWNLSRAIGRPSSRESLFGIRVGSPQVRSVKLASVHGKNNRVFQLGVLEPRPGTRQPLDKSGELVHRPSPASSQISLSYRREQNYSDGTRVADFFHSYILRLFTPSTR